MNVAVSNIIFDALSYVKKLKHVGAPEEQTTVHAEEIADLVNHKLVSKRDSQEKEDRVTQSIELMKRDLKIWFGSILVVAVTFITTFIVVMASFLHK